LNGTPRLQLDLRPSRRLAALIVGAHAAAAVCAALALPGVAGGLLATALVGLGVASARSRALLRAAGSVRKIAITPGGLELESADGRQFAAEAAGRRYVGRLAVMLPLRRPSRRTLLVTADMLDPDGFRRLRLWALWGRVPPVAGVQLSN